MIEVSTDRLKLVAKTLIENSDIPKGVWPGIQSSDDINYNQRENRAGNPVIFADPDTKEFIKHE
ncbi:MAG: hypothetical protein ACYCT9_08845 [Leptospirillum sp.]|jgi:hypothetical protein